MESFFFKEYTNILDKESKSTKSYWLYFQRYVLLSILGLNASSCLSLPPNVLYADIQMEKHPNLVILTAEQLIHNS